MRSRNEIVILPSSIAERHPVRTHIILLTSFASPSKWSVLHLEQTANRFANFIPVPSGMLSSHESIACRCASSLLSFARSWTIQQP